MKLLRLYKHKNNNDVAFMPFEMKDYNGTTNNADKDVTVVGKWFNIINYNNIHEIGNDKFFIRAFELENWKEYKIE